MACPHARNTWLLDALAAIEAEGVEAGLANEHLAECQECYAAFRIMQRLASTLSGLSRAEVPADLDGRVVAAVHAGYLQDRAVNALEHLETLTVPSALDALVEARLQSTAPPPPPEEPFTAEQESDPQTTLWPLQRTPRREAPRELSRRLDEVLAAAPLQARAQAQTNPKCAGASVSRSQTDAPGTPVPDGSPELGLRFPSQFARSLYGVAAAMVLVFSLLVLERLDLAGPEPSLAADGSVIRAAAFSFPIRHIADLDQAHQDPSIDLIALGLAEDLCGRPYLGFASRSGAPADGLLLDEEGAR